MEHAVVGAVAGDDARRLKPGVDGELVQRVEVVRRLLAAKRREVLARAIESMDVVARVAVRDVQVAVRRDVEARAGGRRAVRFARSGP